jgi:hypothetical protein
MRQITRDLYTSGRVWLSLSHSFSQNTGDGNSFDLVKVNGDFVTFNAGALFVLSLWGAGKKTPDKFYIPEYKIEEFRMILSALNELKEDERYVRDGELTEAGKPSNLYYRLALNNKKYIDLYFVENDYNGDKSINIAIEMASDSGNTVYAMYDSNVVDLIDVIPRPAEIVRYKQSAAELFYLENFVMGGSQPQQTTSKSGSGKYTSKKTAPRTVNKVDRTSMSKETVSYVVDTPSEEKTLEPINNETVQEDSIQKEETSNTNQSGYDYSNLLEDE